MHAAWKKCVHGSVRASCPATKRSRQMEQRASSFSVAEEDCGGSWLDVNCAHSADATTDDNTAATDDNVPATTTNWGSGAGWCYSSLDREIGGQLAPDLLKELVSSPAGCLLIGGIRLTDATLEISMQADVTGVMES